MNNEFHTESTNFISTAIGGVDPRTGLFNINMPLVKMVANDQIGPTLDLSLSYSPLGDTDLGFGKGFALGFSYYDSFNKVLVLSTGERHRVVENGGILFVKQKKLETFKFQKKSDCYLIVHKSGIVEKLAGPDTASALKMPLSIYAPSGHSLTFKWSYTTAIPHLTSVVDMNRTLLSLEYNDNISTTFNFHPTDGESFSVTLNFKNNNVASIVNSAVSPGLLWSFDYETVGSHYIVTELSSPTGLVQRAMYKSDVMKFPANAGMPALPAVERFIQYPGAGQPNLDTSYSYSDANYLAYGSGLDWVPDEDNLYGVLSGYEYWTREINGKDNDIEVIRTFNNFHLQTKEETRRGAVSVITETEYYAKQGISFDNQPAQFQLPKQQRATYKNSDGVQRVEVSESEFDTFGNPTKAISPDGTITLTDYYDVSGELGAPSDPLGFVRFMKSSTTVPAASEFSAPVSKTSYGYDSFDALPGAVFSTYILPVIESNFSDGEILNKKETCYNDKLSDANHSRIELEIFDHYGPNGDIFTNEVKYSYEILDDKLVVGMLYSGFDGIAVSSNRVTSRATGLLLSETDASGIKTEWVYDKLGRMTSRLLSADTPYENEIITSYEILKGTDFIESRTVQEDPSGNIVRTYFDGLGREISQERNLHGESRENSNGWFKFGTKNYNNLGDLNISTMRDLFLNVNSRQLPETFVKAEYEYNDWGSNDITTYSDGTISLESYDPVIMRSEVTRQTVASSGKATSIGTQVVQYNIQQLPVSISRVKSDDTIDGTVIRQYDGAGRLRRDIDEVGNITEYEYDRFGRVVCQTLSDGSTVSKTYASHSSEELITNIIVTEENGHQYDMGWQEFDSLGRLLATSTGGRTSYYKYEGASPNPEIVTTPAGQEIKYQYIAPLGYAVSDVSTSNLMQRFSYDETLGLMVKAEESKGVSCFMSYTQDGKVNEETFSPINSQERNAKYLYSLLGAVTSYTDVTGTETTYQYNVDGRVIFVEDPAVSIDIRYDDFSRIIEQTVTDKLLHSFMVTTFGYDDFSREILRTITSSEGHVIEVSQKYLANGQVGQRITINEDSEVLRDETYIYDCRNRLVSYKCEGYELTVDPYGKFISAQEYIFDALSNIKTCVTYFDNESDITTFHFSNVNDPTQLSSVTHSHPDYPALIELVYDQNGRMILDESGRQLDYDDFGRLSHVSGPDITGGSYLYDAMNRLSGQQVTLNDNRELYYRGDTLVNEIMPGNNLQSRLVKMGNACLAVSEEKISK